MEIVLSIGLIHTNMRTMKIQKGRYGESYRSMGFLWKMASILVGKSFFRDSTLSIQSLGKPIQGPAVVIANHQSFGDWYLVSQVMGKTPLFPLMGRCFFSNRLVAFFLRHAGCIPKSVFSPDNGSALAMMRVLKEGHVLLTFPEARINGSSRFLPPPDELSHFLKRVRVPVYGVHINGATLISTKWGKRFKGGLVEVHAKKLFEGTDFITKEDRAIWEEITSFLKYDDYAWLAKHPELHYQGKAPAEGLESLLWKCPLCGKEHTIRNKENAINCTCGFETHLDDRFRLDSGFDSLGDFIHFCLEDLRKKCEDPAWKLTDSFHVTFTTIKGKGKSEKCEGQGVCSLSHVGFFYTGTPESFSIPLADLMPFPYGKKGFFALYRKDQYCVFYPFLTHSEAYWAFASTFLNQAMSRTPKEGK